MEQKYEPLLLEFINRQMTMDLAHDLSHVKRVVKNAKALCKSESGCLDIVLPAAYLHDCFSYPKDHVDRKNSSTIAADKAITFLKSINYEAKYLDDIHHAIVCHSFSADVETKSLEANIVQDADRLDSLGAIGITRCIQVSTLLNRPFYLPEDPFCEHRIADDGKYCLDHFYTKILKLADLMKTESGSVEARKRTDFIRGFIEQLKLEF